MDEQYQIANLTDEQLNMLRLLEESLGCTIIAYAVSNND